MFGAVNESPTHQRFYLNCEQENCSNLVDSLTFLYTKKEKNVSSKHSKGL